MRLEGHSEAKDGTSEKFANQQSIFVSNPQSLIGGIIGIITLTGQDGETWDGATGVNISMLCA